MIVDMNVLLGRWPFAPLKYESAEDVLGLMDRASIEKAVVTSLNSVFYYDAETGNREVGEACKRYPDRLIPFVVINPHLLRWKEHLRECVEAYGARGIKLHPDYHKYSLIADRRAGGEVTKLMDEAVTLALPVYIQTSLYDMRHHPGYCFVWEAPIAEVAQALELYPRNSFLVGGARWFGSRARELVKHARRAGVENFAITTDGIGGPWDGLRGLVNEIGGSRILFSSRTPILYSEASKQMIEHSEIDPEDRAKILGGNAARLLKLSG